MQENPVAQSRETSVTIGNNKVDIQIVLLQAGTDPVLLLSPDTLRVGYREAIVATEVSANIEFEITAIKGSDWITLLPQEEKSSGIQRLKIAENRTSALRVGSIRFRQKEGDLEKMLTVIQTGNQYTAEMRVPFGKMGFIEPLENTTYARKTAKGIREWKNGETVIKFFVNVAGQPLPEDSLFMEVRGHAYEDACLELKINDEKVGNLTSSNYQCISLQGLDGNKHYPDLDTMVIHYRQGLALNYNTSNYGTPAVHLNYSQNGKDIEWSLGGKKSNDER